MLDVIVKSLSEIEDYKNKKYLIAVSGGVDSMVLLSVFSQLKFNFGVAHCNFQLRGKEADKDQCLVKKTSKIVQSEFHTVNFDTIAFKKENKLSTQMAARELRYSWFDEIKKENGYHYIVTAHHLDDNVETVLLNLARGTGVNGIVGMKTVSNYIVRPMLSLSKKEVLSFAKENNVEYREDESNQENDYKRNKIRNQIIPLFQEMNPSFNETMGQNMKRFNSVNTFYIKEVEKKISSFDVKTKGECYYISIEKVKNRTQLLYEFLKQFNFNYSQVIQLSFSLTEGLPSVGKYLYSNSHNLLIDRDDLIVSPGKIIKETIVNINKNENSVTYPIQLTLNEIPKEENRLLLDSSRAFLDAEKLSYPLQLRKWKNGDVFKPFGMAGKKKISDYLIDNKISRTEKEETFVITSREEIVWLVGHRISEDYKISEKTKNVLNIIME